MYGFVLVAESASFYDLITNTYHLGGDLHMPPLSKVTVQLWAVAGCNWAFVSV